MGSPISPVIANFNMDYEKAALESAPLNPRCWFRYIDDTFLKGPHGPDKLKDFLHHPNSIHQSIRFTMETEHDHLGIWTSGVYRIPCECGRVYIGQKDISVDIRLKEH
jgi:hypothetical protein